MKKLTLNLTTVLIGLTLAMAAQAGKPVNDTHVFYAEFSGPVSGSGYSNPTNVDRRTQNIVFNKPASEVSFNLSSYFDGSCFGSGSFPATMQLYEDFLDADLTAARFWFRAPDKTGTVEVSYVLELFDTEPPLVWSDAFPPETGSIDRTAESWEIRTTKKKVKNACTGSGNFDDDGGSPVTITLLHDDPH